MRVLLSDTPRLGISVIPFPRETQEGPGHSYIEEAQVTQARHASQTAFMAGRQHSDPRGELPEAAPESAWIVNGVASLDRLLEVFHGMAFWNQTMDWAERCSDVFT